MLHGRRRWLAAGAAAGLLAIGASAGIAATGAADDGFLADVAKRLGISEEKLTDAIRDATIARIDQAVKDGDLTEEQGERLKEAARSGNLRGLLPVLGPLGKGFGPGFGRGGLPAIERIGGDFLQTAADYLGMTTAELREAMRDGDSLADVAKQKGKSVDGLKTAIRNAQKADLDQAVKDGKLTQAQATRIQDELSEHVDELVEGSRGFKVPHFGFGFGSGGRGVDLIGTAADYLGLTRAQLREELSDGDSLADVAQQKGKSVDGLETAMTKSLRTELDKAVADDALTKEQADKLYDMLSEHVDDIVDEGFGRFGFHERFRGLRGGMDFGFGPGAALPPIPGLDSAIEPPVLDDEALPSPI
jgi:polyhydroxyalkanoate synthesis regulator phasin